MTRHWFWVLGLFALATGGAALAAGELAAADARLDGEIQAADEAFVKDFNAGKAEAVVGHFLPEGELVDEQGNVYHGQAELAKLFSGYFAKYPGATLGLEIESIRAVGDSLAIEEGTRYLSSKNDGRAQVRYIMVRAKTDGKWRIASTREFYDEPAPRLGERLAPLGWLVGEWVSEDADAATKLSYRWSEDGNFLLGDFQTVKGGETVMKSSQRIGWDSAAGKVRSWLFDADGGFSQGTWTLVDDGWVIKSQATLPDGTTGSATVTFVPKGKDQFTIRGTDRIVGDGREADFEMTVSRAPPVAKAKASSAAPGGKLPAAAPSR